jgi:hypothetical protein
MSFCCLMWRLITLWGSLAISSAMADSLGVRPDVLAVCPGDDFMPTFNFQAFWVPSQFSHEHPLHHTSSAPLSPRASPQSIVSSSRKQIGRIAVPSAAELRFGVLVRCCMLQSRRSLKSQGSQSALIVKALEKSKIS